MCGLFGYINGDSQFKGNAHLLRHRGPDAEGEYSDDGLYLKHYRLAILGKEQHAHQPMTSRDGSLIIVFNGEIYNYKEIAESLGEPELAQCGDTRVLVEFLSRYGVRRLDVLNGMFAIVLYDKRRGELYLLRDRLGIKPLYYCLKGGQFYFSSEIKCFRGIVNLALDEAKLIDYLDQGIYPVGEETFYGKIVQVAAGTWVRYRQPEITKQRYYDLKDECRRLSQEELSVDTYEALLSDSIRMRLRSDVPLSLHYSGGTDSTALLLKTKEVWGWDYPLVAYTMKFSEEEFDESRLTDAYCRAVGVSNPKVLLSADEVPQLAGELHDFEDEPYGGIPTIAYYKLNKKERTDNYIVSIEGQGGDETFGGYRYHIFMALFDLYRSGSASELLDKLLAFYHTTAQDVVRIGERLIESGFKAHTDLTDFRHAKGNPKELFIDWLKTIQLYDILENKIPRTLRFHDRASMACGREVRFPLLDHHVLSYGLSFSHALKYKDGLSKYPLRMIIKRHLQEVYSVPKRSVVTPQSRWLHGELKDWAYSRIGILEDSGMVPERYFSRFRDFYERKEERNSFYVWQLINLSFFCQKESARVL